jgi:hypothetical protein
MSSSLLLLDWSIDRPRCTLDTHEVCPMVLRLPCGLPLPSAPPTTGLPGPVTLPQAPMPGGTPRAAKQGAEGSAASAVLAYPELAGGHVTSQQRTRVKLGASSGGGSGGGFDSKGHGNAQPLPLPPPLPLPLPLPLPFPHPLSASGEGAILPGDGRICLQQVSKVLQKVDKDNPTGRKDIQLSPESILFCSLSRKGTELETFAQRDVFAQGEREGIAGTPRSGVRLGVRASSFA